jgi:hypothetical protein
MKAVNRWHRGLCQWQSGCFGGELLASTSTVCVSTSLATFDDRDPAGHQRNVIDALSGDFLTRWPEASQSSSGLRAKIRLVG